MPVLWIPSPSLPLGHCIIGCAGCSNHNQRHRQKMKRIGLVALECLLCPLCSLPHAGHLITQEHWSTYSFLQQLYIFILDTIKGIIITSCLHHLILPILLETLPLLLLPFLLFSLFRFFFPNLLLIALDRTGHADTSLSGIKKHEMNSIAFHRNVNCRFSYSSDKGKRKEGERGKREEKNSARQAYFLPLHYFVTAMNCRRNGYS
ncbi:MAG: hypothetical protein J3R72DRAFT_67795 [Linnemannia gamsii]|nr:MAG: hypothetical protein J3R72DRAFT_67795 [Linnemannia gamsii]